MKSSAPLSLPLPHMATYLAHLFLYPTKRGMAERTSIAVLDPPQVIHAAHPLMEVAAAACLGPAIYDVS